MKNFPSDHRPRTDRNPAVEVTLRKARTGAPPATESQTEPEFIFIDGTMFPFSAAAVHIAKVAAGNGSNVFEGLCLYSNGGGQCLFRLDEHIGKLRESAWRMDIDCDYTDEEFVDAIFQSIRENRIAGDGHIRLSLFVTGDGPTDASGPVSLVCTARPRESSAIHSRIIHAAISSWRRVEDPLMPPRVRAEANSHNTRFALLEAFRNGYDQALFVSKAGKVVSGVDASFLMVRDGCLISPPENSETVGCVARSTFLQIASEELGVEVQEREIDRSELTHAAEAMFCGSGVELRAVLSINKMRVGEGHVGPITRRLWHAYETTVRGQNRSRADWLRPLEKRRERASTHSQAGWRRAVLRSEEHARRLPRPGEIGLLLENGYEMGDRSIR